MIIELLLIIVNPFLSENHIRDLMNEMPDHQIVPFSLELFNDLNELGYLDDFRSYYDNLLLRLQGTQYFSSK